MAQPTLARRRALSALNDHDVRVGIYLRRSTDDENLPYSIDVQDTRLLAYIPSQPGWSLVRRWSDDASGATTERDDLQKALAAARTGVIDVLLVMRVDRFSRNSRDVVTLLDELDQSGVVFRPATEPLDTSTPMGRMLVQMLGTFAQFERDLIIERGDQWDGDQGRQGPLEGRAPPLRLQRGQTSPTASAVAPETAIVRLIFDLFIRDRLGSKAIAR